MLTSSIVSLIAVFFCSQASAVSSPSQQQYILGISSEQNWHKYIRSPSSTIVRPVRVLSEYTVGNVTNPDGLVTGKNATILSRTRHGATPMIVVDFGQNIAGFLNIDFGGASNLTKGFVGIRLAFSETLQYLSDRSDFSRSYNGDSITPGSDQIAVRSEPYTWNDTHGCAFDGKKVCSDGLHGFRYMRVYLDALSNDAPYTSSHGEVKINSMSLNFTGFLGTADTFTGWFESSDEQLNQWWYDGVYTNDMCIDTFRKNDTEPRRAASPSLIGKLVLHDGAKRDRDPYVGDLSVASRTAYLSHDVPEATRNVLADLGDHQRADGWIPPASINDYTLPLLDYPLHWVTCSYDLFMYTEDVDYITKYYPHIIKVLDLYYPSITDPKLHLISKGLKNSGGYGDYAFLPRQGPVTYYNALYIIALQNSASIAAYLGNHEDATRWTARAALVSVALNTHNFDTTVGAFFDGKCGSHYCPTHAQDGNAFAIISGAANRTLALSSLSYLSKHHALPWGNAFYDNDVLSGGFSQRVYAFISYFEISARFQSNLPDSALEEIRRLYGWMSSHDPGITQWEGIGSNGGLYEGGYTSLAHGWATGIVPALTNHVLGITPTAPGFATWSVRPMPGDVMWARGVVPSPRGEIGVSWEKDASKGTFHLVVSAPKGTRGVVSVPVAEEGKNIVFVDGISTWDEEGSLDFETQSDGDGYVSVVIEDGGTHVVTAGAAER